MSELRVIKIHKNDGSKSVEMVLNKYTDRMMFWEVMSTGEFGWVIIEVEDE